MAHTPGNWMIVKSHRGVRIIIGANAENSGNIARIDARRPDEENDANARLIKAAPWMYNICKAVIEETSCTCHAARMSLDTTTMPDCVNCNAKKVIAEIAG